MQYKYKHLDMLKNITYKDIHEIKLSPGGINQHVCGYISPSGKIFSCKPYHHIDKLAYLCRHGKLSEKYEVFEESCYANDIELGYVVSWYETYIMIELGYVKVAAYMLPGQVDVTPETAQYSWVASWLYPLTEKQAEIIYPR